MTLIYFVDILKRLEENYGYSKITVNKKGKYFYITDVNYDYDYWEKKGNIVLLQAMEDDDDELHLNKLIEKLSNKGGWGERVGVEFEPYRFNPECNYDYICPDFDIYPIMFPLEIVLVVHMSRI